MPLATPASPRSAPARPKPGRGGATRCDVRVRCGRRGRHSCGMPIIHERRRHSGTNLGAARPVGT
eukprot:2903170-Prymnesium_polylepis.1